MGRKKKITKKQYGNLLRVIATSLIIGFIVGIVVSNKDIYALPGNSNNYKTPAYVTDPVLVGTSEIELCFTPPSGCGKLISNLISRGRKSIYVQAYGMTSVEIIRELIAAHKRGVKVEILLDASNLYAKYSGLNELQKAGIEVLIDKVPGIAHNKVIIIDQQKVITGSFNFTSAADKRNAENVIIVNDQQIAKDYMHNWLLRKSKSIDPTKVKQKKIKVRNKGKKQ